MAAENNFLVFDENMENMLEQDLYKEDTDRVNGFKIGLARSNVNNKALFQTTKMCSALGEFIKENGQTASDAMSVEELKNALKSALSTNEGFLPLTGGIMTGEITSLDVNDCIVLKKSTFDCSNTASPETTTEIGKVISRDMNGEWCGQYNTYMDTNGNLISSLDARRMINGVAKQCSIRAYVNSTGTALTYAPNPASTSNTNNIATTAWVRSTLSGSGGGLATFKKASNGYIKFNNGIIIQWGRTATLTDSSATFTFPIAFTSTNYSVSATPSNASSNYVTAKVKGKSTTKCTVICFAINQSGSSPVDILAIGY